ncbi:hypothetical protein [Brevundimonas subvibrioides]|uniref:DUF4440 domain-containing protein n=1 Tax=Brevundimonas subvibrioides (strain ATCC 15264 / DSM 4735 / LMG 14903 / NBRC 16000 / CB 81) TaxID=633149 RepID=D9QGT3_BRESC|nr:hypothetical protein [Brevundimonas subvibrioides]ADL00899.1 conserved hypothetical protein [Brevundimonas subvibrioides ATCC 15264]
MSLMLLPLLLAGPMTTAAEPVPPAVVQSGVRTIGVGDPLRRPILDALRPSIQRDLGGQPVQFVVDRLRVQGDWAFYAGSIQQPGGRPIDFGRTRYASALENGVFDGPGTYALLRRSGGTWRVVTFVIGPTDVAWLAWPDEFNAPAALFD